MDEEIPDDLIKYDEAAKAFDLTVAQVRWLVTRGRIKKYMRGALRGVWVSRAEVAAATAFGAVDTEKDERNDG